MLKIRATLVGEKHETKLAFPMILRQPVELSGIQALRAFAALYVFVFHSRVPLITPWPMINEEITRLTFRGWLGVDVFFVISGFVMSWACILSRPTPEKLMEFSIKRFLRVVPLYWLATFLSGLLLERMFSRVEWSKFFLSLAFIPSVASGGPFYGYASLLPGWTLNYEICFYLLFGFCLLMGRKAVLLAPLFVALLVVAPQIFAGSAITLNPFESIGSEIPYLALATNPIMLEFALGCIAAIFFSMLRGRLPTFLITVLLFLSGGVFIYCVLFLPITGHHPILLGLPSAILIFALSIAEDAGKIRFPKWLVEIGASSYAIYLFHLFVNKLCAGLSRAADTSLFMGILSCIVQTLLLIWIAKKIHYKFEQPLIGTARVWAKKTVGSVKN